MKIRKLLFIFAVILFFSCISIIPEDIVEIEIREVDHPYMGDLIQKVSIYDKEIISELISKFNQSKAEIVKFTGNYYFEFRNSDDSVIVLRTNGRYFEVINGLDDIKNKIFRMAREIDMEKYF